MAEGAEALAVAAMTTNPATPAVPESAAPKWPEPTRETPLDQRFWVYHEANPVLYDTLARLALTAVQQGKRHIGAKALWERMRWELWMAADGDEFALNNNFTSRYARLLMAREPELRGVFELRELRS